MAKTLTLISVLFLNACTAQHGNPNAEPDVAAVITSAYWRGRAEALDKLRANPVWRKPIYVCPSEVSWVDPDAELPSWKSRGRNITLIEDCAKNSGYTGGVAIEQRRVVDQAR